MTNPFTDRNAVEAHIIKDGWIASRPWSADLVFKTDGVETGRWKSWQAGFRTKRDMIANINAVDSRITIVE